VIVARRRVKWRHLPHSMRRNARQLSSRRRVSYGVNTPDGASVQEANPDTDTATFTTPSGDELSVITATSTLDVRALNDNEPTEEEAAGAVISGYDPVTGGSIRV
jgi:hypothetical protein